MSANPCGCDPEANHRCEQHPDGHHRDSLSLVWFSLVVGISAALLVAAASGWL